MLEANDSESTIRVVIQAKDGKVLDGFSSDNRATVFQYKPRQAYAKAKGGTGTGVRICGTLLDK